MNLRNDPSMSTVSEAVKCIRNGFIKQTTTVYDLSSITPSQGR